MAEEIQDLLNKIQRDGIEKADAEAEKIVSAAKDKASELIADAERKSADIIDKAQIDGKAFEARAKKSLEQAARDAVLAVTDAVNVALQSIVEADTSKALSKDSMSDAIAEIVKAYCSESTGRIELLVADSRKKQIQDFFTSRLVEEMQKGLEIKSDENIGAGFKVSLVDGNVHHDFTAEAVTEALCALLRPNLAEIVRASQPG